MRGLLQGVEAESTVGGWGIPPRSVSTLYVSSGLRLKLRLKPKLLALLAGSFVKPVLLTADFSHHGLVWVRGGPEARGDKQ